MDQTKTYSETFGWFRFDNFGGVELKAFVEGDDELKSLSSLVGHKGMLVEGGDKATRARRVLAKRGYQEVTPDGEGLPKAALSCVLDKSSKGNKCFRVISPDGHGVAGVLTFRGWKAPIVQRKADEAVLVPLIKAKALMQCGVEDVLTVVAEAEDFQLLKSLTDATKKRKTSKE